MKKTIVHSHEQAFMNGSLEKGLGSLNGTMGFTLDDALTSLQNVLMPKAQAAPAPVAPVVKPATATMTYVKYGAMALGGVVGLMLIMKMMKGKSA